MEEKLKHLEFIQGVINRMASNSFMLKGWAVTLVAGIFALAAKDADKLYILVAYIPILIFWGLDAYYLLQERLYRSLYDEVRNTPNDKIDFSLTATCNEFNSKKNSYSNCFLSVTEFGFYFSLAIVCSVVVVITQILV